jgi:molybdate transport repressor ModE-like protein
MTINVVGLAIPGGVVVTQTAAPDGLSGAALCVIMGAMLDVRRLLVLRAVAHHGSLAAAARALGYTQPAVTHHVRRLEQETGVRVITHDGRGVQLTAAGRALVARAEAIATELTAAEAELSAEARNMAAQVRLAALPGANASLVPRALAELRTRHPEAAVSLVEAGPLESWSLLDRAECDLAVSFDHPILPGWPASRAVTVPLFEDPVLVILPAAHPLAGASELPLNRLAGETWILSKLCQREMVRACGRAGFTPNVALVTDDYQLAVPRLVAGGLGIGLTTAFLSRDARPAGVRLIPAAGLPPGRVIALLPRRPRPAPAVTAVLEALQTAASAARQPVEAPAGESPSH